MIENFCTACPKRLRGSLDASYTSSISRRTTGGEDLGIEGQRYDVSKVVFPR
jgi:hypothetical protein